MEINEREGEGKGRKNDVCPTVSKTFASPLYGVIPIYLRRYAYAIHYRLVQPIFQMKLGLSPGLGPFSDRNEG